MESFNLSNAEILDASTAGPFPALKKAADLRPELKTLALARGCGHASSSMFEGFLLAMQESQPLYHRIVLCNLSKDDGNTLFKQGKFREARAKYVEAAKKILGEEFAFPVDPRKVRAKEYMSLVWQEMMDIVACFNNMAQCYIREGNLEEALEWLQEAAVVYLNQSFAQRTPLFCMDCYRPQAV
jgi:pentatricopeptide repeat protein